MGEKKLDYMTYSAEELAAMLKLYTPDGKPSAEAVRRLVRKKIARKIHGVHPMRFSSTEIERLLNCESEKKK